MTGTLENRRSTRRSSMYAVTVEIGDRRIEGRIRDHSETGCRLALERPLRSDDVAATIVRGEHRMEGVIAWRDGCSVGVGFDRPPPEGMFAPSRSFSAGGARPAMTARYRRPGLGQEQLTATEARDGRAWIDASPRFGI